MQETPCTGGNYVFKSSITLKSFVNTLGTDLSVNVLSVNVLIALYNYATNINYNNYFIIGVIRCGIIIWFRLANSVCIAYKLIGIKYQGESIFMFILFALFIKLMSSGGKSICIINSDSVKRRIDQLIMKTVI